MIITTHKQFPNYKRYEIEYEGRPLVMETGKLAELCNSAVLVSYGETTVLVTCTASARPKDGVDYFPLSVDFNEKLYAVGRIPGSFMRREGKPSVPAVLASRLIDRPMRPLFPSDLRNDVIIACEVLSVDRDCSPEITAMIGASAAVSISDVPFNGPIAGIVLGWDGEKYLFNPTQEQRKTNRMTTTIAATHKKIVMIESEADQVPDDVMYEGIVQAHEHLQPVLDLIDKMVSEIGKPKFEYEHHDIDHDLFDKLEAACNDKFEVAMDTDDKTVRDAGVRAIVDEFEATLDEEYKEEHGANLGECVDKLQKKIVRRWLANGKRVDGRGMEEVRPLAAEVHVLPRVHGSGMFTRGQTQILNICTLAPLSEAQKIDGLDENETSKRYMHHYNFPSYSVGETKPSRGPGRREIGHGALAERALVPVLPTAEEFPYAIRTVSETMESNGSTSQASICASTLSLMAAGVPIKAPVAGISCGLVTGDTDDDYIVLTDIQGLEDFFGDMDFKVGGTHKGITSIQMDIKIHGLTRPIIEEAIAKTREARLYILDEVMAPVISEPRKTVSQYAPKIVQISIDPQKIGDVVGKQGKVINKIIEQTGVKIDIEDDGSVSVCGTDQAMIDKAVSIIKGIVTDIEPGQILTGTVVRIMTFGAFVELAPNKDGMVHISKLSDKRVAKVEDVVNIGDEVTVKVIEVDKMGRINLSMKPGDLAENK